MAFFFNQITARTKTNPNENCTFHQNTVSPVLRVTYNNIKVYNFLFRILWNILLQFLKFSNGIFFGIVSQIPPLNISQVLSKLTLCKHPARHWATVRGEAFIRSSSVGTKSSVTAIAVVAVRKNNNSSRNNTGGIAATTGRANSLLATVVIVPQTLRPREFSRIKTNPIARKTHKIWSVRRWTRRATQRTRIKKKKKEKDENNL